MDLPWWLPLGGVPELAPDALWRALQGPTPPQLVDVRSTPEFESGHIAGALSVPITVFPARLPELALDRARVVVAICLTAHRSIPAVRLLQKHGHQAWQLQGGMLAWRAARLPERRAADVGPGA